MLRTSFPGDRHPAITESFPEGAFFHNTGSGVLNVKEPPFCAKGDGVTDDTAALCAALTFVRTHQSPCSCGGEVLCGEKKDRNWLIYLPAGTYLVSSTVSQNWPARAFNLSRGGWSHCEYFDVQSPAHERELYEKTKQETNVLHANPLLLSSDDGEGVFICGQYQEQEIYAEVNWGIRIIGENRERTVIKLKDHAEGFGPGAETPVLANVLLERGSNVNISNFVENLTIHTGNGNPGAAALRWNASNCGGIRNVTLRSGDGQGAAGLLMDRNNAAGYCRDLTISGFDTAIRLCAGRESMIVLEHAKLEANKTALDLGNARSGGGGDSVSARKLQISAPEPVVCRRAAQLVLLDSELTGDSAHDGICVQQDAFLLARRLQFSKVRHAVSTQKTCVDEPFLQEFYSQKPSGKAEWTEIPAEDVPENHFPQDPADWAVVEDYGAAGDGVTDDTEAVQRAMNAGKEVVFFSRHIYLINGTVTVPASVREIAGVYASVVRHKAQMPDPAGIFLVNGASAEPLRIRRFVSAGGVFADHKADRDLVLEDIYVEFNHIRDSVAKDGFYFPLGADPGGGAWQCSRNAEVAGKPKREFVNDCIMPLCAFSSTAGTLENVHYFGRMLDSEHVENGLYPFKNSTVWIFGFKSENAQVLFSAEDHTRMEVLGGSMLQFAQKHGPQVRISDSEFSGMFYLWHYRLVPEIIAEQDGRPVLAGRSLEPLKGEDAAVVLIR